MFGLDNCQAKMTENPAILFFETAWTPMVEGNLARLEELTYPKSFPSGSDDWLGLPWLTSAIHTGNPVSVAWVLKRGAKVNHVDDEGFTALMSALQVENDCQARYLDQPKSAEEAAQLTIQLIELLLAAGAEINLAASLDETALHVAARWSSPTVVRYMLVRGANPCAYDREHIPHSPADCAKSARRWDVAAILREAMAQRSTET